MKARFARNPRRRGLSLVELMISLSISAALLVAVASAFAASAAAVAENDEFFRATQAGRVALNRMLTHVRRGAIDEASTSSSLRLITEEGTDLTYQYNAANKKIWLITNNDLTDGDYTLASNVTSNAFVLQNGTDFAGQVCVSRVCITLTVQIGDNKVLFSGSAAPRRNLAF